MTMVILPFAPSFSNRSLFPLSSLAIQTLKYHPVDDPELTMEKIYATLPDTWVMMKQIVVTYVLSSDSDENLDTLNILEVFFDAGRLQTIYTRIGC